jgi:hypothetical protein
MCFSVFICNLAFFKFCPSFALSSKGNSFNVEPFCTCIDLTKWYLNRSTVNFVLQLDVFQNIITVGYCVFKRQKRAQ